MIRFLKRIAQLLLPPIVVQVIAKVINRFRQPEWEYIPKGWEAAKNNDAIKGWQVESIRNTHIRRWPSFIASLQGTGPFGQSMEALDNHRPDLSSHNMMMTYAYALNLAAVGKTQLSMLDWGGGIGHYFFISRAMRPDLTLNYHCKDFPVFAEYGKTLIPDAHFHSSDSWQNQRYDFVLASSSLQYSEDWCTVLTQLAAVTQNFLLLTRLPLVRHVPSYVMVQRPYAYGYQTEYLGWCLNRSEVLTCAEQSGLKLVREFVVETPPHIDNAPEQCDYWGFLFKRWHKYDSND